MPVVRHWIMIVLAVLLAASPGLSGDKNQPEKGKRAPDGGTDQYAEVMLDVTGKTEKEATRAAYKEAVSRVVGTLVEADALRKHEETIKDRILDVSGGFVKSHEVVKKDVSDDGLVRVRLKVVVEKQQIAVRLADEKVPRKPAAGGAGGEGLLAERNKRQEAQEKADVQLVKLYEDVPALVTATTRGKPRLSPDKNGVVVDVEVGVDPKAYAAFVERATGVFGKLASSQESGTFTGEVGARRLFTSYDGDFPNLNLTKLSVPTNIWAANLFPESVLKERIKRLKPASAAGYGVWLMTATDSQYKKTQWKFYWVEADYEESTKSLRGEPELRARLLDKDGKVVAEHTQPLLRLVGIDGFKRLFVVRQAHFVTSLSRNRVKEAVGVKPGTAPKFPFAPVLEIAPLVSWNGSICNDLGIGYSPVIQHSLYFKLADEQLKQFDRVEVSASLGAAAR